MNVWQMAGIVVLVQVAEVGLLGLLVTVLLFLEESREVSGRDDS